MASTKTNLQKLNWYELQQALYAAHDQFDQPKTRKTGEAKIRAIYHEYGRRGMTNGIGPAHVAQLHLRTA